MHVEGKGSSPLTRSGQRTFTTEDRTSTRVGCRGASESSRAHGGPGAGECVNWVSVSGTQRMLREPDGLDSLERR